MIQLITLVPIIVLALNIFLGLFLLLKAKETKANLSFTLLVFSVAFWVFSNLMVDLSGTKSSTLFWSRATIIGPAFVPALWLYFSYNFPKDKNRISIFKKFILTLPPLLFLILSPTSWNIKGVELVSDGTPVVHPGPLYIVLLAYFLLYLILAFVNLYKNYKKTPDSTERTQMKFIFTGAAISAFIGLLTNLVLLWIGISEAATLGPSSAIFLIGATSYAVLKHHLFSVRVITTEVFAVALVIVLFVNAVMSTTIARSIVNSLIFVSAALFGVLLVRSVLKEIETRAKLEKAYAELKRIDEAKSEFISMASHQLRTPLSSIKGYISMILEGDYGKIPKKAKEKLQNVAASNERLVNIVNDLLNISRIELGKIKAEKEQSDIIELVSSVHEEMKKKVEERGLEFKVTKPSSLPKVNIDKLKIRQVLLNLIDNAIRYTNKGSIELGAKKEDENIIMWVKDTGEGLTEEDQKQIFEGFTRGEAGKSLFVEGSGLGLYVGKKYMDLHNGDIWAESEGEGKGSTFYVKIPIKT